jgi:outer membrane biosynthesis protein TonB
MLKTARTLLIGACLAAALAGCMSAARPHGPLDSFALAGAAGASAVGVINDQAEPREVLVTLPPGADMHHLVARLALNKDAVITVTSSGARVVQENGVTANDFSVPVTYALEVPGDKKPWVYKVLVREMETNAQLGAIRVPQGATLAPAFNPAVNRYTVQVPFATTAVQLGLGGQSRTLKSFTIDGAVQPGSSITANIAFPSGQQRVVQVETLAEDGVSRAQYTITILRSPPDNNAFLAALDCDQVPLEPAYAPTQMSYQVVIPFSAQQVVVRARPQSAVATLGLEAVASASGGSTSLPSLSTRGNLTDKTGAAIDIPPGSSLSFAVVVTAEDGSMRQYIVDVFRAAPDHNADLGSLAVSAGVLAPAFAPRVPQYGLTLPTNVDKVVITPAAASPLAKVMLSGASGGPIPAGSGVTVPLEPGSSTMVSFEVRAEDGFQRHYRVQVSRAPDGNALLQTLQVNGARLAPAFAPQVILYDAKVTGDLPSVTVAAAPQSRYAAVLIDGQPAGNIARTIPIPPLGMTRVVLIDVMAQNGTAVRYTVRASRETAAPQPAPAQPAQPAPAQPATAQPQPAPAQPQPAPAAQPAPKPAQQPQPAATAQPAPKPAQPAPAAQPAPQPAASAPVLAMPADSGKARIVVKASGLKLAAQDAAAIAAAADQVGPTARITVRNYRTDEIITQYPGAVEAGSQEKNITLSMNARSNGVTMAAGKLVEVEVAIPMKSGKYLYYTRAQAAGDELRIDVPFLLYGPNPRTAWPALQSQVPVAGISVPMPARAGDLTVTVQLAPYGTTTATTGGGAEGRGVLSFAKPVVVPEGATLKYTLSARDRNGRFWTGTGTAQAWTTSIASPQGFEPVVLAASEEFAPLKPSKQ